ncbi:hypothetical protein NQD34_003817, partial [Periophthalmus magnuspinnatus]
IFDNVEFDCRTPEDWLSLGVTEGSSDRKPIPAKALLPTENAFISLMKDSGALTQEYNWQLVGVLDYNKETSLYLVEKVHLKDLSGNSILSQQQEKTLLTEGRYWVPRIRVLFKAEDPRIFVQRIKNAKDLRDNTEALLLYNLCVDCMPICEGTSLDSCSLQRIKKYALTTPGLRLNSLGDCVKRLEEQIQLDYSRTMNRMTFDYVVKNQSVQVLSHIIIPKKEQPLVLK